MSNTVELLGYYGSDLTHACSAWTSTARDLTSEKIERVPALLKMLAVNGHHTPFEKSSLHFLITTDIASHIHLLKHRIGVSINGESARYKEIKDDKAYIPLDWPEIWKNKLQNYTDVGNKLYHECIESLTTTHGMNRKRAKESARFFKTYNSQIQADVMFNFRSFSHFIKLRHCADAQIEIRDIAKKMMDAVKSLPGEPFKYTLDAFECGKYE